MNTRTDGDFAMKAGHLHIFRTVTAILATLCVAMCSLNVRADELPSEVKTVAESYVIYDADTGEVLMGKDMDAKRAPASITKIMTALLVCESFDDMSIRITMSRAALDEMVGNSSHLPGRMAAEGETMTMKDMLYGMYLSSANECAAMLGIVTAGSTQAFAQMMNDKAREIGCTGTHFVNAHGLDNSDHYSTAHDMALIFTYALKNKKFYDLSTTYSYTIPATNKYGESRECIVGHKILNKTVDYPDAYAGKTGYTHNAGRTLVTAANIWGHNVVTVIMGSTELSFYDDTILLLEYAKGYYQGLYDGMNWEVVDTTMKVSVPNNLAVRDWPGTKGSNVVGALYDGDSVHVVGIWGKWAAIDRDGTTSFVHTDYLRDESGNKLPEKETNAPIEHRSLAGDDDEQETTPAQEPSQTIPAGISELGESTQAVETTPAAEQEKSGGNVVLMVIIILIIVALALALVFFVVRIAAKRQRELVREYYKDDDKLYYEDPGDEEDDDPDDDPDDLDDEDLDDEGIDEEDMDGDDAEDDVDEPDDEEVSEPEEAEEAEESEDYETVKEAASEAADDTTDVAEEEQTEETASEPGEMAEEADEEIENALLKAARKTVMAAEGVQEKADDAENAAEEAETDKAGNPEDAGRAYVEKLLHNRK